MPFPRLTRVAYNDLFLKSIDNEPEEVARRGHVQEMVDDTFVKVRWDDEPNELRIVHIGNLRAA